MVRIGGVKIQSVKEKWEYIYIEVMLRIADELNRIFPAPFTARSACPKELYVMNNDTLYNSSHYLCFKSRDSFKEVEIWDYYVRPMSHSMFEEHPNEDIPLPDKPVFISEITRVNELIAASIKLIGLKHEDLVVQPDALSEPIVPTESGIIEPVKGVVSTIDTDTKVNRINMDLWNDIQAMMGLTEGQSLFQGPKVLKYKSGVLKATVQELAIKHGVSTTIVINYKKRGVKCIKCGDISVFSPDSFRNAMKKYDGDEGIFRLNFLCKKCRH